MADYSHLLDQEITQPNATEIEQCPEGEYIARINDFELGSAEWTDKQTGQPRSAPTLRLDWHVLDEGVKAQLKRDTVRVQQDLFLDIDEATGQISMDKNKNVQLGRIRAALGINEPGQRFSLNMLKSSSPATVRVAHQASKNGVKYARVIGVTRATN